MKKRLTALLCCALLVFQLAAPPKAKAANYVYFVAAGENVLPLSDATMPFWNGGYLYIASSIFTGIAREALDIGRSRNDKEKLPSLYGSSGRRTAPTMWMAIHTILGRCAEMVRSMCRRPWWRSSSACSTASTRSTAG